MRVNESDLDLLGVKYIETDTNGDVVSIGGVLRKGHKINESFSRHHFSFITDKVIYWADLELDYCGG